MSHAPDARALLDTQQIRHKRCHQWRRRWTMVHIVACRRAACMNSLRYRLVTFLLAFLLLVNATGASVLKAHDGSCCSGSVPQATLVAPLCHGETLSSSRVRMNETLFPPRVPLVATSARIAGDQRPVTPRS